MLTRNVFRFLKGRHAPQRYGNAVKERVQQEPAVRLLPALLDLPLFASGTSGAVAALEQGVYLALRGPMGSGRSLALLQLAWHWAANERKEPVVLVSLAHADVIDVMPRVIFEQALNAAGCPLKIDRSTGMLKAQPWLLLIDEWEALPPERQADWRIFVLSLPQIWPEARGIVVLPETEGEWSGFQSVNLPRPDEPLVRAWLMQLLPQQNIAPILAALAPGAPLAALPDRLLEVALLALTYPAYGLPVSRVQLHERAYTMLRQAYGVSQPALLDIDDPPFSTLVVGRFALRQYEMARDLAAAVDMTALVALQGAERNAVARLLAGMLSDPGPVYSALWGREPPTPADLLILAGCLRDRPAAAAWGMRILTALLDRKDSRLYQEIVQELAPVIPAMLVAGGNTLSDEQAGLLLTELAPMLGGPLLLALLDNTDLRPGLRWEVADALRQLPSEELHPALGQSSPPDALAQALRYYMLALGNAEDWRMLGETEALSWGTALLHAQVSPQRRAQVIHTLLQKGRPAELRLVALKFIPSDKNQSWLPLLAQACADNSATVRHAAFEALNKYEPQWALRVLNTMLWATGVSWPVLHDVLEQLARYTQREVSVLLARFIQAPNVPLAGRLKALGMLAERRVAGSWLLCRLLQANTVHYAIGAAAAWMVGQRGELNGLDELCQMARSDAPALVRQSAIEALGRLGQHVDAQSQSLAAVYQVLDNISCDTTVSVCAVYALGTIGSGDSVPTLCALLGTQTALRIRSAWMAKVPHLPGLPFERWTEIPLPPDVRLALLTALAVGETNADQPTSFDELVEMESARIRRAAAEALVRVSRRTEPEIRQTVYAALLEALRRAVPGNEARCLLRCLVEVSADGGLQALAQLLADPALDPGLGWLVIDQLGANPKAMPLLLNHLEYGNPHPFISSKLVQVLGQYSSVLALPALRHTAELSTNNVHLRMQAVAALGRLADPAAESALLHLVSDTTAPPALRGAAAEALSNAAHQEMRHLLRELLRRERQSPELKIGALHALGRAGDRESLAQMLRYTKDENPNVALAALAAIAAVADRNLAPALVHLTQDSSAEQHVRLRAVGLLLQLYGEEYLPFLRLFLDRGPVSLQLQALEYLLTLRFDALSVIELLANTSTPLVVRLRAMEAISAQGAAVLERSEVRNVLCTLLLDSRDDVQLRTNAAAILGQTDDGDTINALVRCVQDAGTAPRVRRRCIDALATQASAARPSAVRVQFMLSQIADDPLQLAECRAWATHALSHVLGFRYTILD